MRTVWEEMRGHAEIKPVKKPNQAATIEKLEDGSMRVVQKSGEEFTIPAGETDMMAFVVFTMLNGEVRE